MRSMGSRGWSPVRSRGLLAGVAGLIVGASGVGVAGAATGGAFMLGQSNRESATATLTSDAGAPLALHAKQGQPPLAVNSSTQVRRLNASLLGGVTLSKLQEAVGGRCGSGISGMSPNGSVSCASGAIAFTASQTWVVPAGVNTVTVQAVGGGGGGAAGEKHAGGGGSGAMLIQQVSVTPGERLDIVVGRGGAGQAGSAAATGGTATVIYEQSGRGETLVSAGGGRPGRAGSGTAVCGHGAGGVPHLKPTGLPVFAQDGQAGSCLDGGGAAGWPGAGGAPGSGKGAAGSGQQGSVLLTLGD
jgi:hypothetical protein